MNRKDQTASSAGVLTGSTEPTFAGGSTSKATEGLGIREKARLFDSSLMGTAQEAVEPEPTLGAT